MDKVVIELSSCDTSSIAVAITNNDLDLLSVLTRDEVIELIDKLQRWLGNGNREI